MANIVAFRDQENLAHGAQAAAAAKPQNQLHRQPPKTPGAKAPKTPFKIPLNDENGAYGAKAGPTLGGKDKKALVTPMAGPQTRAPLGQKTTNARAKSLQTPGPGADKPPPQSKPPSARTSARRPVPKPVHTQATKLDVLQDTPLEEREIEYMPPRPEALPDPPDDIPADFDLSVITKPRLGEVLAFYKHIPDDSGVTPYERERMKEERERELDVAQMTAQIERDSTISGFECWHEPECAGECPDRKEHVRRAEEKFRLEMARIDKDARGDAEEDAAETVAAMPRPPQERKDGPSALSSKSAAAALSMPRSTTPAANVPAYARPTQAAAAKSTAPAPPAGRKLPPAALARNAMTLGAAASRSTVGYAKGRATSATLRALNEKAGAAANLTKAGARCSGSSSSGKKPQGSERTARAGPAGRSDFLSRLMGNSEEGLSAEDLWQDVERENAWLAENALGDF